MKDLGININYRKYIIISKIEINYGLLYNEHRNFVYKYMLIYH